MILFFALNVFWKVLRGSWKRGAGQRRRQGVPTNIFQRMLGAQMEVLDMGLVKREFWQECTKFRGRFGVTTLVKTVFVI